MNRKKTDFRKYTHTIDSSNGFIKMGVVCLGKKSRKMLVDKARSSANMVIQMGKSFNLVGNRWGPERRISL